MSDKMNIPGDQKRSISLFQALIPVVALVGMLSYNVFVFGDDALSGSNQFILLMGAAIAAIIGFVNGVSYERIIKKIASNIKSTSEPLIILLFVGALSGAWMVGGVIPTMVYYGLKLLNPTFFLVVCVLMCVIISLSTGSSWTTSATIGVAMVGIGNALGISEGMTAGAVISGAYFGDKISPLSETTNLAPAMAKADLFTHIRYMLFTTMPSIVVALVFFLVLGFFMDTSSGVSSVDALLQDIEHTFTITPVSFLVPGFVLFLIIRKTKPLIAIILGTLLGVLFAVLLQRDVLMKMLDINTFDASLIYMGILNALTVSTEIKTENPILSELFCTGGMSGMLSTIWLIICAMAFGGALDAIGALKVITRGLLKLFDSTFGLFASTAFSCMLINLTASDQYLSIVLPGKMFSKSFKRKGLAPENLSRTLEDSGTVTSVLVPWNTCGAYQSGVLGVSTLAYLPYAVFNIVSPIMTLIFAAFRIKIRSIKASKSAVSE